MGLMINEVRLDEARKRLVKSILLEAPQRTRSLKITERVNSGRFKRDTTAQAMSCLPMRLVSRDFEEYFTGFFEGDGYLGDSSASITQVEASTLLAIQEEFEGGILYLKSKGRDFYSLSFGSNQYNEVLSILSKYVVGRCILPRLNYELGKRGLQTTGLHSPTYSWFVGFWDAEGYSYKSSGYTFLGVGQKDKSILDSIQGLFNSGKVHTRKTDGISIWSISSLPKYRRDFKVIFDLLVRGSFNEEKRFNLILNILTGGMGTRKMQREDV